MLDVMHWNMDTCVKIPHNKAMPYACNMSLWILDTSTASGIKINHARNSFSFYFFASIPTQHAFSWLSYSSAPKPSSALHSIFSFYLFASNTYPTGCLQPQHAPVTDAIAVTQYTICIHYISLTAVAKDFIAPSLRSSTELPIHIRLLQHTYILRI